MMFPAAVHGVLIGAPLLLAWDGCSSLFPMPCFAFPPGADGRGEVGDGAAHGEGSLCAAAGALPPQRGPSPTAAGREVQA